MDAVRGLRTVRNEMRRIGWPTNEVPGWETRGHQAVIHPRGAVNHWTAPPRSVDGHNAPSLRTVTYGRAGLRNALCHTYSSREPALYLIAARVAWHAGRGAWPALTGNRGTAPCLGHEAECAGPRLWSPGQLELVADLDRIQADVFDYPLANVIDHYEWARPRGRKTDRSDVGGPTWRARLANQPQEEIVATLKDLRDVVGEENRVVLDRVNQATRLAQAACAGAVAAIRADVGLDPAPASDLKHVERIRAGVVLGDGEPYDLAEVRRRLEAKAAG